MIECSELQQQVQMAHVESVYTLISDTHQKPQSGQTQSVSRSSVSLSTCLSSSESSDVITPLPVHPSKPIKGILRPKRQSSASLTGSRDCGEISSADEPFSPRANLGGRRPSKQVCIVELEQQENASSEAETEITEVDLSPSGIFTGHSVHSSKYTLLKICWH